MNRESRRAAILLSLYALQMGIIGIEILSNYVIYWSIGGIVLQLLVVTAVYSDAKGINREKGIKVIGAGFWAALCLIFFFVGTPLYVFTSRRKALLAQGNTLGFSNYEVSQQRK